MWPVPTGPVSTMRPAKAARIGFARSTAAGSPPTITSSVPSQASFGVRLSGASTSVIPFGVSSAASLRVEAGSDVEQSTTSSGLPAETSPSAPKRIASTCGRPRHAQDHDVAFLSDFAWGGRLRRAAAFQVVDRLALGAREHGQGPALLDDVLRHAVAHEPDADKADPLFHVFTPEALAGMLAAGQAGARPRPFCDGGSPRKAAQPCRKRCSTSPIFLANSSGVRIAFSNRMFAKATIQRS